YQDLQQRVAAQTAQLHEGVEAFVNVRQRLADYQHHNRQLVASNDEVRHQVTAMGKQRDYYRGGVEWYKVRFGGDEVEEMAGAKGVPVQAPFNFVSSPLRSQSTFDLAAGGCGSSSSSPTIAKKQRKIGEDLRRHLFVPTSRKLRSAQLPLRHKKKPVLPCSYVLSQSLAQVESQVLEVIQANDTRLIALEAERVTSTREEIATKQDLVVTLKMQHEDSHARIEYFNHQASESRRQYVQLQGEHDWIQLETGLKIQGLKQKVTDACRDATDAKHALVIEQCDHQAAAIDAYEQSATVGERMAVQSDRLHHGTSISRSKEKIDSARRCKHAASEQPVSPSIEHKEPTACHGQVTRVLRTAKDQLRAKQQQHFDVEISRASRDATLRQCLDAAKKLRSDMDTAQNDVLTLCQELDNAESRPPPAVLHTIPVDDIAELRQHPHEVRCTKEVAIAKYQELQQRVAALNTQLHESVEALVHVRQRLADYQHHDRQIVASNDELGYKVTVMGKQQDHYRGGMDWYKARFGADEVKATAHGKKVTVKAPFSFVSSPLRSEASFDVAADSYQSSSSPTIVRKQRRVGKDLRRHLFECVLKAEYDRQAVV
ncbi:hypothetical protein EIP91_010757, partial [Steccherinum ochraceum]